MSSLLIIHMPTLPVIMRQFRTVSYLMFLHPMLLLRAVKKKNSTVQLKYLVGQRAMHSRHTTVFLNSAPEVLLHNLFLLSLSFFNLMKVLIIR